jgi:P27 family predicted phage terminase small subunit
VEVFNAQADEDPVFRGLVIKTAMGNEIQNPLIGIINKAAADIVKISGEFGLTPASRSRVSGEDDEQEQDPAAKYFS